MIIQQSKRQIWQTELEYKTKKIPPPKLAELMTPYIKREDGLSTGPVALRWWCIWGRNYAGRDVEIRCKTRQACLENLATLNGYIVE